MLRRCVLEEQSLLNGRHESHSFRTLLYDLGKVVIERCNGNHVQDNDGPTKYHAKPGGKDLGLLQLNKA